VALLSAVILVVKLLSKPAYRIYHQPASGMLLGFCFILVGYFTAQMTWQAGKPAISSETLSKSQFFTAIIDSKPDKTAKSYRYEVIIQEIKIDDTWQPLNSKAILYNLDSNIFTYGDVIMIKGRPAFLERQKNPNAFDYALFLNRKDIYLQAFCREEISVLLDENKRSSIRYLAMRIGDVFEDILSQYLSGTRELNMARAMVIGRRNQITPEMEYVYEATGTSHILAVSGLHVGIIFLVDFHCFQIFQTERAKMDVLFSYIIFHLVLCSYYWFFAICTSCSIDAIICCSCRDDPSEEQYLQYLACFCILYLLFSPNLIFSVSFQFSYMAVLGIVYFYKKIYAFLYLKNPVFDFFWQITVLSISVQLATFAINIYYFHSFPALFFLTNLFAIPTAILVVIGSLTIFFHILFALHS
jgi:competence protein ComEC